MKPDVTTKLLLAAIAGGLWALALRPTLQPIVAKAQEASALGVSTPALAVSNNIYLAAPSTQSGRIYRFKGELGKPVFVGEYGPSVKAVGD